MKAQAIKLFNSFDGDKYSIQERKEMSFKAVDKIIFDLMSRQYYDGIEKTFDDLNEIKKEIIKL